MQENLDPPRLFLVLSKGASLSEDLTIWPSEKIGMMITLTQF